MSRRPLGLIEGALRLWARGRWRSESGAVSPIFALLLVPLMGGLGMAVETGNWYLAQRGMQNAADSAVIAAATNGSGATNPTGCATAGDYCFEAKAAASRMGYTDLSNNVSVAVAYLTSGCPGAVTNCYKVTITNNLPLGLLKAVGYTGTTGVSVGGGPAQQIQVVSIARATGAPVQFCSISLATGKSFTINGGPNVNLNGCDLFSNGDLKCDGSQSDTGVNFGEAVGTSTCGVHQLSGQPSMTPPPFANLSSNIPAFPGTCAKTPKNPTVITSIPTSGLLQVCGTIQLGGNINITTPGVEIEAFNGSLDLNGFTLSTSGSGSATVIFSGNSGNTAAAYPIDSSGKTGILDIAAPNFGNFSGVAVMQDIGLPDTGGQLDMTYTGNGPSLFIQGLLYFPNGTFTIKGDIDMHSKGLSCIGIIAQDILVSGTGGIFDGDQQGVTAQCEAAGLTLPGVPGSGARLALVQ